MGMEKTVFGTTKNGEEVSLYVLRNCHGMKVKVSSLGAAVVSVEMRDFSGERRDVVLGYDKVSDYEANGSFFGVVVGRNANRIENAQFELEGKTYHIPQNEGKNILCFFRS